MTRPPPNTTRTNTRPSAEGRVLRVVNDRNGPRAVDRVYVYFNKQLTPMDLRESSWFLRVNSWTRVLTNAVALGNYVRIDTGPLAFDPGANRVRYQPGVPDLRDIDGLLVEPFVFPVTTI
jgi:hypothetical protein